MGRLHSSLLINKTAATLPIRKRCGYYLKGLNMADINRLKSHLISDEGLRLKPYLCTAGKLTIGIGRNLDDVGITTTEAHILFENDLLRVESSIQRDHDIGGIFMRLDEARQEALLNMCFQLGLGGLKRFRKMWAALAMRDYKRAYTEALDSNWAKQTPNRANRVALILLNGDFDSYKGKV